MTALQAQPWLESFSTRELEVLTLVSNGLSNAEIAEKLYLSVETVKWYNKQMYMKLGVNNRIQAVNKAAELNLLDSEQNLSVQEINNSPGNLPAQLTSYVGREKEIGEIKGLLKSNRLVVLTGAGGSGKTRLAMKVGEELQDAFHDGVWLVELANLRDPSLVLQTIAKVLDITEGARAPLDEALKRYLSRRNLLLLIDNLEHLLECASMIGDLLAATPGLSVLATSREPLHIYGEQEFPVLPLALPDLDEKRTSEELERVESIALFIKRAKAVEPTITLDEETLKELARICVRLDGLPLAIELCAPMVKVFPLNVIAERIENDLDAIPSGPRDMPARQQTLRDTIQWSYDLLDENEGRLFQRLAVFNGGGTLQAVEAICGDGIFGDIGNILSALVNKNMVLAREGRDGEIHFSLLETIRQFGNDKLLASGQVDELKSRHAKYYMELAGQASVELRGPEQILWTDRLIEIHDNMRVALEWVIKKGKVDAALQFICDMDEFWLRHSDFEEGQRWMEQAITLPNARQFQEEYSMVYNYLTWFYLLQTNTKKAMIMAEQALPLARSQSNKFNIVEALLNLGLMLVIQTNDFDKALIYQEEARNICQEIHDEWELARVFHHLAVTRTRKREYNIARSLYTKSFNLYNKLGDTLFQGIIKRGIGNLEMEQNNLQEGIEAHREALRIAQITKSNLQVANNIFELGRAAKIMGNHHRAVRLYLASKKIFEDMGSWWSGDEPELEETLEIARAKLDEAEFQFAKEAGQKMTMEEAIEYALGAVGIEQ